MQLNAATTKFKLRRKATSMNYASNYPLSNDAMGIFQSIAEGLLAKVAREKTIPAKYQFVYQTDMHEAVRELEEKGVIRYDFTDAEGVRVYAHTPDADLIKKAMGWDRQ